LQGVRFRFALGIPAEPQERLGKANADVDGILFDDSAGRQQVAKVSRIHCGAAPELDGNGVDAVDLSAGAPYRERAAVI